MFIRSFVLWCHYIHYTSIWLLLNSWNLLPVNSIYVHLSLMKWNDEKESYFSWISRGASFLICRINCMNHLKRSVETGKINYHDCSVTRGCTTWGNSNPWCDNKHGTTCWNWLVIFGSLLFSCQTQQGSLFCEKPGEANNTRNVKVSFSQSCVRRKHAA